MIPAELKKKMNPMLMKVIVASVLVHVVGAFIAGVVTIATIVIPVSYTHLTLPTNREV